VAQPAIIGQAGHDATVDKVAAAPPTTLVVAIPVSSEEEEGVPDATSTVESPTVSD
jgi:phosphoribosylcarboxyaminoimidazole (NCAIR) mutase